MELFPKDILDTLMLNLPLKYLNNFRITNKRNLRLCNEAFHRIVKKVYPGHWEVLEKSNIVSLDTAQYCYFAIKDYYNIPYRNDYQGTRYKPSPKEYYQGKGITRLVIVNNYVGLALAINATDLNKNEARNLVKIAASHSVMSMLYLFYLLGLDLEKDSHNELVLLCLINAIKGGNYEVVTMFFSNGIEIKDPLFFAPFNTSKKLAQFLYKYSTPSQINTFENRFSIKQYFRPDPSKMLS